MPAKKVPQIPKRKTSHEKGKAPAAALTKRRSGPVTVEYIGDKTKRLATKSIRKRGLQKKALEYSVLTGETVDIIYDGSTKWSSETIAVTDISLHAKDTVPHNKSCQTEVDIHIPSSPSPSSSQTYKGNTLVPCTNPLLSPMAVRVAKATAVNPSQIQTSTPTPTQTPSPTPTPTPTVEPPSHTPTTTSTVNPIVNNEPAVQQSTLNFCKICGADWYDQKRLEKQRWIGCKVKNCNYWVESKCLLGCILKPKQISELPFLCPSHRKK